MLEWFGGGGSVVSQGNVVKSAKFVYNQLWRAMTQELAPQDSTGSYARPKDPFVSDSVEGAGDPARVFYLYTGNACPWCHRCLLAIALLGIEDRVKVVELADDAEKASRGGWIIREGARDPLFGARDLRQVYDGAAAAPGGEGFRGRCTAPLLVDGATKRVVSNNSTNIMRRLNDIAIANGNAAGAAAVDLFPADLAPEIEAAGAKLYTSVNNAVYQCGFSTSQSAHDEAARKLFQALDDLEAELAGGRYLLGDRVTAADLMLLPTLCRFDACYAVLFKCACRRIRDYPNLHQWMQRMFALPGSVEAFDADGCKRSYFQQLFPLNPSGIVPYSPSAWQDMGIDPANRIPQNQASEHLHIRNPSAATPTSAN